MKYSIVFALAAVSSAFVVPTEEVFADIAIENNRHQENWLDEAVSEAASVKDSVFSSFKKHLGDVTESTKKVWDDAAEKATNVFDDAVNSFEEIAEATKHRAHDVAFDAKAWLDSEVENVEYLFEDGEPDHDGPPPPPPPPPHHGPPPPKDGPPHRRPPPGHHRPPHHKRPHHRPHHGPHHEPNETVYEILAKSKYTSELVFLINQYPDLVDSLNSTKANFTIFAPTNRAFEKIPEHAPKPSKEQIKALLSYHVVPDFYPAGRVLVTHTVPTLLKSDSLSKEPQPQRLRLHLGLNGLTVNFYSRIVAVNIFGTNGVIHGVDSLILPPPRIVKIIDLLPAEFSTLELGLTKTGLLDKLNTTKHEGGTFFAPSNRAFAKLGPRINAFLFSEHGLKYLKALLEYHVVPKHTLYSDALYEADAEIENIPRGKFHFDLPTLLKDRRLSVDVARFGGFIEIKINGFNRVVVQDGIAKDGVIHVPGNVIIPPRQHPATDEDNEDEEIELEDLKRRLAPYVSSSKWDL